MSVVEYLQLDEDQVVQVAWGLYPKSKADLKAVLRGLHTNLSGPDMIDTIAKLTGHEQFIPTAPDIGNLLVAAGKELSGERISEEEMFHAIRGFNDPKFNDAAMPEFREDQE